MKIKVLGTGCPACKTLYKTVEESITELNLSAELTKVEDILEIINYQVLGLPALVIDEKIVSAGKNLSKEEVKKFITINP